jgi:hypothetical protein
MYEIEENGKTKFQNLPQDLQDRLMSQMDAEQKDLCLNGNEPADEEEVVIVEPVDDSSNNNLSEEEIYNRSEELQRKLEDEISAAGEIPADSPMDLDVPVEAEDTHTDIAPVTKYGEVPGFFSRIGKLFK